jgi:hypothetical protein
MYRTKFLTDRDWSNVQRSVYTISKLVLNSNGRMAVFVEVDGVGRPSSILIPTFKSDWIESFTPKGWEDLKDATDRKWTLLVGTSKSFSDFGLIEGVIDVTPQLPSAEILEFAHYTKTASFPAKRVVQ